MNSGSSRARIGERAGRGQRMESGSGGGGNFLLSDSQLTQSLRSLLPFVAALSGTRNASWMEEEGRRRRRRRRRNGKPKPQRIFPSFRTLVGTAHEHREGMRQTDILHPLSFQQVAGPAIVSSTMKKRDSWTRFGREITALAAKRKFPDFGGAEFAAAFTRFHVALLGR